MLKPKKKKKKDFKLWKKAKLIPGGNMLYSRIR